MRIPNLRHGFLNAKEKCGINDKIMWIKLFNIPATHTRNSLRERLRGMFPWHFHICYTIVIVEAGSMEYVFQNCSVTVRAGQLMIINPYESHFNTPVGFCSYKVIFLPIGKINCQPGE